MTGVEHFATVAHRWLGTLRPVAGPDLPAPVATARPVIASPVTRPEESTVTSTDATTTSTAHQVLDLPLPTNDSGATTVRGYLIALLTEVWRKDECFSGKRPFGNSGWQYDVYEPMVRAGMVVGSFDEDDDLDECDTQAADRLILAAIRELGTVGGVVARGQLEPIRMDDPR